MKKYLKKLHPRIVLIITITLIVVALLFIFRGISTKINSEKSPYDDFAQCITESGAQFYGAYWCPACNNQKARFEKSAQFLPYIECATPPNDRNQNLLCKQEGIEAYPTWRFKDGSEEVENLTFDILSEKTGCPLPK